MDRRKKSEFTLLKGTRITADHLAVMYQRLTGRRPTDDELKHAQQELDQSYRTLEEDRLAGVLAENSRSGAA